MRQHPKRVRRRFNRRLRVLAALHRVMERKEKK